ncbi:MAG: MBL fold metallo-hydrolase [Deltaproteobacteria bacterium]|nr:MBL fold metallo-hydrolase [Deltaproteobacteria bacterium]
MKIFDGLYGFIWNDYSENNCNTYLIDGDRKILVDPGHRHLFGHVERQLKALNLSRDDIDVVIITHGHPDHQEAWEIFGNRTRMAISIEDHELLKKLAGHYFKVPEPDFFLREGDLTIGSHHFQVLLTPGHSPGSICLYWPERKALFAGDVVFNRGIGRTDLPGGNGDLLKESIRRISTLDIEYLLTGHGPIVKGADEVQLNFRMIEDQWFDYL